LRVPFPEVELALTHGGDIRRNTTFRVELPVTEIEV
jgi:hypothetical protein